MKEGARRRYRVILVLSLLPFVIPLLSVTLSPEGRRPLVSLFAHSSPPPSSRKGEEPGREPAGMVPLSIVYAKQDDCFLLCDKNSKALKLYRSVKNAFQLIRSYPCIVGSNNGDKRKAGDLATPEGIYFLTSSLIGKGLPQRYGYGAFSLNYPNLLDQKEGKRGSGIWLHGYPDQAERPASSEGCVVVQNKDLKELTGYIKTGDTPMVIVDAVKYRSLHDQEMLAQELSTFLDDWERAWESMDTGKYLTFYSEDFVNSQGMNYRRFKAHKERVNAQKKFIKLGIEKRFFLLSQKNHGRIAVLRLNQDYRSSNFQSDMRKILYLKEEHGKWKITGDIAL